MRRARLARRLVFAAPEIAINLMFATINAWYLFYLVGVAQLEPLLAGAAFFIGRVVDGFFDPVVGRWSDLLALRRRRKPMIVLAIVPTIALFVLIWLLPVLADGAAAKFLLATLGFSAFTIGYTCVTLPRLVMLPGFEPDHHGRTTQVAYDMALAFAAIGAAMAGLPALVALSADGAALSDAPVAAWLGAIGILAFVAGLAYLPFLAFFIEPVSTRPLTRAPLAAFAATLRGSDLAHMAVLLFLCVTSSVLVQSMLPFLLERRIGIAPSGHALVLGLVFATAILCFPIWALLGRRIGKRHGLACGGLVFALCLVVLSLIPAGSGISAWLLAVCVLAGAGVSALSLFPWSMIPDAVQTHCVAHGAGQEGLCTAMLTMTNKLAIATAVLGNATILSLFPSDPALAALLGSGPIPLAACLMMLLVLRRRAPSLAQVPPP